MKKQKKNTLIWKCIAIFIYFCPSIIAQEVIYVSSVGNDSNNGQLDSPFLTLNRALHVAQEQEVTKDTLFVEVLPGLYYLDRPIQISTAFKRPVVVRSSSAVKPCMIGGIKVNHWEQWQGKIYRAYVPEVLRYNFSFEQFYVNGHRAVPARTPNEDWYFVKGYKENVYIPGVREAYYATQQLFLEPKDLQTLNGLTKKELEDVRFRFYHKWDITQKPIHYLNVDSGYIYTNGRGMAPWNPISKGARYIISGYKAALDAPGEWFLDRQNGYVYYYPMADDDMDKAIAIAPTLHQLLIIHGKQGQPIRDLTFENISFQYVSYQLPKDGEEPMQAAANVEAGIELNYAENISFLDCELQHTGGYGLWMKKECHHNKIEHCYLADLGAGGIKIGEPCYSREERPVSSYNQIDNSIITHVGRVLPCGVGIAIFNASDNKVTHNDISDLLYSAISIGWTWGYNQSDNTWTSVYNKQNELEFVRLTVQSPAVRNYVAYNHIHHIGWGELSDMGAVYTLGESPGTQIVHNVIHDVLSYDYGGWGLYTDEGSSDILMRDNLVYRCKSGGFHQHYGKANQIINNIFAFGFYYQLQYTRVEPHVSFIFKHNIVLQDKGVTLAGPWEKGELDMDTNLYWAIDGDLKFGNKTFKEWKKLKEPHSLNKDPLFEDATNADFKFKSTRNIRKIGFKPFDYSTVGVYGSDKWKQKADLSEDIIKRFQQATHIRLKK